MPCFIINLLSFLQISQHAETNSALRYPGNYRHNDKAFHLTPKCIYKLAQLKYLKVWCILLDR